VTDVVHGPGRRHRRRTLALSLVGAAGVAAIAGGTALFPTPGSPSTARPSATSPTTDGQPDTRLVGVGHAAIAVPDGWGTNVTECGIPQEDTVVIDVAVVPTCATRRPEGVDSVEVTQGGRRFDFTADAVVTIDGVPAERQATTCGATGFGGPRVCSGTVYVASMHASFRAESSTGAATVERLLEGLRLMSDRVGVPGYRSIVLDAQGRSGERYLEALRDSRFIAEIRTRKVATLPPGYVLDVSPGPGTMLRPGALVTVTVVDEAGNRRGAARAGSAAALSGG
jgi:hypothetical protein